MTRLAIIRAKETHQRRRRQAQRNARPGRARRLSALGSTGPRRCWSDCWSVTVCVTPPKRWTPTAPRTKGRRGSPTKVTPGARLAERRRSQALRGCEPLILPAVDYQGGPASSGVLPRLDGIRSARNTAEDRRTINLSRFSAYRRDPHWNDRQHIQTSTPASLNSRSA